MASVNDWPYDTTRDGVKITPGLRVRDYNYDLTTVVRHHHSEDAMDRGKPTGEQTHWWITANNGMFDGSRLQSAPTPTWEKTCEKCGSTIARYRGGGDVFCSCGASYNAAGQRLRDDWQENPAWRDEDVDDLTGSEIAALRREGEL